VLQADWCRRDGEYQFTIIANRFVHGMVRSLVGTMTEVALGKMTPDDCARLLTVRDRRAAGPTAPAHGLCLMKIDYERA
jgi:tRNA pseudouridine38-40 synthase